MTAKIICLTTERNKRVDNQTARILNKLREINDLMKSLKNSVNK